MLSLLRDAVNELSLRYIYIYIYIESYVSEIFNHVNHYCVIVSAGYGCVAFEWAYGTYRQRSFRKNQGDG